MARNRSHANRAAQPLSHHPTGSDLGRRRHHRALPPTKVPFGKKALLKVAFTEGPSALGAFWLKHKRNRVLVALRINVTVPVALQRVAVFNRFGVALNPVDNVMKGDDADYLQPPILLNLLYSRERPLAALAAIKANQHTGTRCTRRRQNRH